MKPDLETNMRETMNAASVEQLMPGFDHQAEWEKVNSKINKRRPIVQLKWAAAFLLLVFSTAVLWNRSTPIKKQEAVKTTASTSLRSTPTVNTIPAHVTTGKENSPTVKKKAMAGKYSQHMASRNDTNSKKGWDKSRLEEMLAYYRTNEFVCNGTPCPLQICIVQSVRCAERVKKVATCNTLEPDQVNCCILSKNLIKESIANSLASSLFETYRTHTASTACKYFS